MEGSEREDFGSKSLHPLEIPMGTELNCKSWAIEAAYRMLHHNLHPDVAEIPEQLVVYGGTGKCARDWESWKAIRDQLLILNDDQTLLVQSGKPVGVVPSHPDAPRVLIANSNLVGNWATKDHFDQLEAEGLMMYGQMTHGYILEHREFYKELMRPWLQQQNNISIPQIYLEKFSLLQDVEGWEVHNH